MSKRILSLVLALVMVLGTFGTVFAAAPSDVVGTEYETAVDRLIQLGALNGYPDGSFKPANTITRAEFAAAVVKTKGLLAAANAAKGLPTKFSDVPATSWASGFIGVASNQGLVNGVGYGQFDPESPVRYEEAVTMVMRALGYEEAAQARGGYPYGYLIVANETGLLDAVKGNQGLPASRGLVAQLLDNALEIPMMVQVGYGSQTTWVVSGTMNTEVKLILDELGFANVEGRVVSFDSSRNRITLDVAGKVQTLTVEEGFDFNYAEGLNIKAWYSNNKVVVYSMLEEAKFDATTGGAKIKLVGENKTYVVAKDAYLELNGNDEIEADNFKSDYAKVVLNDESEIVWAKGYTFNYLVIEEVEDDMVYSYGDELNISKYTIVKEGKTINSEDLEEGDILFFNETKKFAEVYNDSLTGEIGRVYVGSFRLDGKDYDTAGLYLDGKDLEVLTEEALRSMQAEGNVELFFDRNGEIVFVDGDLGKAVTSKLAVYLTEDLVRDTDVRDNNRYYLDGVDQDGKKVSEVLSHGIMRTAVASTVKADYITNNSEADWNALTATEKNTEYDNHLTELFDEDGTDDHIAVEKAVVVVVTDEDGKITGFNFPGASKSYDSTGFALDAKYVLSERLSSSIIVFDATGTSVKATTWGALKDIDKVEKAVVYHSNGYVTHMVINKTTNDLEPVEVVGVITDIRKVSNKAEWRVSAIVGNQEIEYTTAASVTTAPVAANGTAKVLVLDEKSGKLTKFETPDFGKEDKAVTEAKTNTVVVDGVTYRLVADAVIIDITNANSIKVSSVRALDTMLQTNNVTATVVLDEAGTTFAKAILIKKGTVKTPGSNLNEFELGYNSTTKKIDVELVDNTKHAEYVVVIGDEVFVLEAVTVDGVITLTADTTTRLTANKIYTANLVKLTDLNKVLATTTFVAQ